jgi:uncharacterized protein YbbK (DUF523 family)
MTTKREDKMRKVLVSACLLGRPVRYDGRALSVSDEILSEWLAQGRVVGVCPEVDAGMPIPRPAAEILRGDGVDVLSGSAQVMDNSGTLLTSYFLRGAQVALSLCLEHDVALAVLAQSSPSCGSSNIYDGSFSRNKVDGVGVTTALLLENAIPVYSQHELSAAKEFLGQLEP